MSRGLLSFRNAFLLKINTILVFLCPSRDENLLLSISIGFINNGVRSIISSVRFDENQMLEVFHPNHIIIKIEFLFLYP